eukprot:scaffold6334_cov137-Isochrysis_galbana.AAC.9
MASAATPRLQCAEHSAPAVHECTCTYTAVHKKALLTSGDTAGHLCPFAVRTLPLPSPILSPSRFPYPYSGRYMRGMASELRALQQPGVATAPPAQCIRPGRGKTDGRPGLNTGPPYMRSDPPNPLSPPPHLAPALMAATD